MGASPDELIIGGNSSLSLMHDAMTWPGYSESARDPRPVAAGPAKFLCPSPGYDRHFSICEHLGIQMLPGRAARGRPGYGYRRKTRGVGCRIKGMCASPSTATHREVYADEVVERLARMPAKAEDFRIFLDNAYAVHHLGRGPVRLADILQACHKAENPDRVLLFGSTSKISFAGSGLAFMAGKQANMTWLKAISVSDHRPGQTEPEAACGFF